MKKLLLIIALLISGLGLNAQSVTIGSLRFTVTSETPAECKVSGYSGEPTFTDTLYYEIDVTIPSKVTISGKKYSVTSIGEWAFANSSSLTSIEIPSGVTSIGDMAFWYCSSLTSIDFGENSQLTSIGNSAFRGCSNLTSIEIPSGVTSIGNEPFEGCSGLTSVTFGENSQLTSIGERAFWDCSSLTSIDFGENSQLTSIGERAFWYCSSLTSIEIPSGVTSIGNEPFEGCSGLTSVTFGENSQLTSIGNEVFEGCSGLTSVTFGENSQLTSIGERAFSNCSSLTSIEFGENSQLTSIGNEVFEGCSGLTSVTFGENSQLTSIGESAFYGCSSLTSIEIPSGVTSIGERAFSNCSSLTSIEFEENSQLTSIGAMAFWYCSSLTSIDFGENSQLTSIGGDAFYGCSSLTSIEIPSGVTSIGGWAFRECSSLTSIIVESGNTVYDSRDNCNAIIETATNTLIVGCQNTVIPNTVTSIGGWAFRNCSSLTSIEIPSGVTSIGEYAFSWCSSLTSIEFEENSQLTSIGNEAFEGCSGLTNVTFGENSQLTSIGDYAFSECSSLTSIEIPSGVTSIGEYAFYRCSSLTSIDFGENSQLASIEEHAFYGCSSLTSIEIPSGVTSIGEYAFSWCSSLTSIEFEENSQLTSIGNEAFEGCSGLTSVTFGENSQLTSIGDYAFSECSSLTSIDFGENSQLTSIGYSAFYGSSSLTSIEIPSGVTSIGERAFSNCSSLTSIVVESGNTVYDSRDNCNAIIETATNTLIAGCKNTVIPNSVTSIGDYAFSECSSLTSIDFGENSQLSSIGYRAFYYCSSLTSIEIPSGVTSIGDYAFSFCSSLTSIEIPSGVTSIGESAFYGCSSLTSIEIPSGVTSIGGWAFRECSSLTSIYCYAESVPETDSYSFYDSFWGCPSDMVIYVPAISVNAYKAASPWNNYTIMPLSCIVTASANPEDAGIITGAGEYTFNDTVTLTATANEGYKFVSWTENGDVVSEEAEYTFVITSDRNLVANFELLTYEVKTSVNIENAGEITGDGNYNHGDTVSMIATANTGYKFLSWMENGEVVSEEAEYTFVITSDRNLVANFELLTYEVKTSVNIENAGEVTGDGNYNHGDTVSMIATANTGYKFLSWMENGEVVSEEAEYTFVITSDRNLVANFELLSYNVTASVNPENTGVVTGAGTYNHGEEVTLTATANEGYKFINWTENGEVVSEEAEYSFEITKDRNLVANFELLSYNVTASLNPENAGVVNGAGTYNHGEEVTLTATANEGYKFINWTENDVIVSTENEYSFIVTKDINLVANFEKTTCNVTVVVNPEEAGTVIGAGTYVKNMSVTLVATANPGYKFVNWTENGTIVSTEREYSFVVSLDTDLVANFISTEGVEELASSFNIYPNPVNDKLYIETQTQTQTVEIYDVYGRRQSMVNGQQSTVIDVSDLNSGVYFVKVVTSEGEVVKRFIKD